MIIETLELAHHALPFVPFTLEMPDGRRLAVPQLSSIAHRTGSRPAVVIDARGGGEAVDLSAVLSLSFPTRPGGPPVKPTPKRPGG